MIKDMKSKRAISGLVATVLMIVVVIATAGIISASIFTITNRLSRLSGSCRALTNLRVDQDYTCKINVNGSEIINVMAEMPPNVEANLSGIAIRFNAYQSSKAIMITPGLNQYVWISVKSLNLTSPVLLPKSGQAATYTINATGLGIQKVESVAVAAVVSNGKKQQTCTYGHKVELKECVEAPLIQSISSGSPVLPRPPPRTCLLSGTKILTENGEKNIEDIKVNDVVLGFDEANNKVKAVKVLKKHEHITLGYYRIELDDGTTLFITGNHLVWSDGYKPVDNIKESDVLMQKKAIGVTLVKIKQIKFYNKKATVYDIRTSLTHNFFANGILVHNKISTL